MKQRPFHCSCPCSATREFREHEAAQLPETIVRASRFPFVGTIRSSSLPGSQSNPFKSRVRPRFLRSAAASVLVVLWCAGVVNAQDANLQADPLTVEDTLILSLPEAQRFALARNPAYLAEQQETEIARGELRQARVYNFNPEFEFETPDVGSDGVIGAYEAAVTQEIEWAGDRKSVV